VTVGGQARTGLWGERTTAALCATAVKGANSTSKATNQTMERFRATRKGEKTDREESLKDQVCGKEMAASWGGK